MLTSSKTTRPSGRSPIVMSKKTLGRPITTSALSRGVPRGCAVPVDIAEVVRDGGWLKLRTGGEGVFGDGPTALRITRSIGGFNFAK